MEDHSSGLGDHGRYPAQPMQNADITKIDAPTLAAVPERVAREYCVLPKSLDEPWITLYCPETGLSLDQIAVLEFVLGYRVRSFEVPRNKIESAINSHFPEVNGSIEIETKLQKRNFEPERLPPQPFRKRLSGFLHCDENEVMTDQPTHKSKMLFRLFVPLGWYSRPKSSTTIAKILHHIAELVHGNQTKNKRRITKR